MKTAATATTTTAADKTTSTTTTDNTVGLVGLGWFDGDVFADSEVGGACWSPEEAKAKTGAAARLAAPGWERRLKSFLGRWKKCLWEPENQARIVEACKGQGLSPNTFKVFMVNFAGFTSFDGKDLVFARRRTLAALMPGRSKVTGGCGLRVVDRSLAVGVELKFLTEGFQRKWLKANADDEPPSWKAGASARMLLMPVFGPAGHVLAEQKARLRARLRLDRAAETALALKKQRDAERRAHVETLIVQPSDKPPERPPKRSRTAGMDEALNDARRALE